MVQHCPQANAINTIKINIYLPLFDIKNYDCDRQIIITMIKLWAEDCLWDQVLNETQYGYYERQSFARAYVAINNFYYIYSILQLLKMEACRASSITAWCRVFSTCTSATSHQCHTSWRPFNVFDQIILWSNNWHPSNSLSKATNHSFVINYNILSKLAVFSDGRDKL